MKSFRKQDMKAERSLGEFMDASFYSKLHDKDGNSICFERITDVTMQQKGIDVIIKAQGHHFFIDEKATLHYSNMMLPTFAFEVNSIQRISTAPVDGWLLNDDLKTEYYMLIWPNVKCVQSSKGDKWERVSLCDLKKNDFTIIEAMLVKKKSILEYLAKNSWGKDRIIAYAKKIRDSYQDDLKDERIYLKGIEEFYFFYTKKLAEKPINIVIRKEILRQLADASYFISAERYVEIQ